MVPALVVSNHLGHVMESCSSWLIDNKLSLHLGKTECMLFGSTRKLKRVKSFHVTCNGHNIPAKESVKYLGFTIDRFLSCEVFVDNIVKKVNSRVKFLYRNCKDFGVHTKQTLASALVQCHLDYSCSSWYSGLTKKLQSKLQVAQNRITRFVLDPPPRSSINYKVLDKINTLKVSDRAKQLRLNHSFNIFNDFKCPTYLKENH